MCFLDHGDQPRGVVQVGHHDLQKGASGFRPDDRDQPVQNKPERSSQTTHVLLSLGLQGAFQGDTAQIVADRAGAPEATKGVNR